MNKKRTFINNYNPTISLAEKTNNKHTNKYILFL